MRRILAALTVVLGVVVILAMFDNRDATSTPPDWRKTVVYNNADIELFDLGDPAAGDTTTSAAITTSWVNIQRATAVYWIVTWDPDSITTLSGAQGVKYNVDTLSNVDATIAFDTTITVKPYQVANQQSVGANDGGGFGVALMGFPNIIVGSKNGWAVPLFPNFDANAEDDAPAFEFAPNARWARLRFGINNSTPQEYYDFVDVSGESVAHVLPDFHVDAYVVQGRTR